MRSFSLDFTTKTISRWFLYGYNSPFRIIQKGLFFAVIFNVDADDLTNKELKEILENWSMSDNKEICDNCFEYVVSEKLGMLEVKMTITDVCP